MFANKQEIENSELERYIEALAERAIRLRLDTAVDFLLESHIPAIGLLHNFGHFAQPLISPLFGADRVALVQALLSDKKNIEKLQNLIQAKRKSS